MCVLFTSNFLIPFHSLEFIKGWSNCMSYPENYSADTIEFVKTCQRKTSVTLPSNDLSLDFRSRTTEFRCSLPSLMDNFEMQPSKFWRMSHQMSVWLSVFALDRRVRDPSRLSRRHRILKVDRTMFTYSKSANPYLFTLLSCFACTHR